MQVYGDTTNFEQDGIKMAVASLREAGGEMVELRDAFQTYKDTELDKQWRTAGGRAALERLQLFIDEQITGFIVYIQGTNGDGGKVHELESVLKPIDAIDNA